MNSFMSGSGSGGHGERRSGSGSGRNNMLIDTLKVKNLNKDLM
jgi:hypothetical protein